MRVHLLDGTVVVSASDIVGFLACDHLTQLELAALRGDLERPDRHDPELDVLGRRGEEHERRYLQHLHEAGLAVVEIDTSSRETADDLRAAHEATREAMAADADVVYQATFFDGRRLGYADFLRKVDTPSDLGAWGYEPEDTKLARHVKTAAVLQLCFYADQLAGVQGRPPERIWVVLGGMERVPLRLDDFAAYERSVRARFEEAVAASAVLPVETYPEPVEHCPVCRWNDVCTGRRRADDHLSLVAGIRSDQRRKLLASGLATTTSLAASTDDHIVPGMGDTALDRLRAQARLQVEAREATRKRRGEGAIPYEPVPSVEVDRGLAALPEPSEGDLFFDIEGDPFVGDEGLEYLFGVAEIVGGEPRFHPFWAHDADEEKRAFEMLVDFVDERRATNPGLHVYHYAPYEPTVLKTLMGRYGTREDEVDALLRGKVLVDLYRVVRQGVRVGTESYSLKHLEPLFMGPRDDAISDASSSIAAYEEWLETADPQILTDIEAYNRTDCISAWRLRDWLEGLRGEVSQRLGSAGPLPRPTPADTAPSEALAEHLAETEELAAALTAGVPADPGERTEEEHARWLLAQLLGWHRREQKSAWWAYFDRCTRTDEELAEDPECIGGLTYEGRVGEVAKSFVHRYRFDPEQDHKFAPGDTPVDPATQTSAGEIVAIDSVEGTVNLKRGKSWAGEHPTALIPDRPIPDDVLRDGVMRVARSVETHGIDADGSYRAIRDLLMRRAPRVEGHGAGRPLTRDGEAGSDAARRLARLLAGTCLPVQGPPGAGKTWTGARMIVDLVRAGKRVGICAVSHKAIGKLLDEVCAFADEGGVDLRAVQKAGEAQRCSAAVVKVTTDNAEVETAVASGEVDVVAGTAWLFARPALAEAVDVLFVDEAGQMSLANVVAAGQAARNLVLLGDPQQLAQPSQGSHPPGAERSALEHLLGDHQTIPRDRGLFLEQTWRLHPEIARFTSEVAYERRLESADGLEHQRVVGGQFDGAGPVWVPVEHNGNRTSSVEEAEAVVQLVADLDGRTWIDGTGEERRLGLDDILVVAPYNAQVACLAHRLPHGARVGTVDKFQGQEAPVAVYSMTASSVDDVPRGMEFLFSLNRLNVATSRARCRAIVVASPELLRVNCRTPRQMRLVNALCRFVEMATP